MDHAVDPGQVRLPVVLVFHQLDRDVLDELAGFEGPGTHCVLPLLDIGSRFAPVFGDYLAEVRGESRQEVRRTRDFEGYLHGVGIDRPRSPLLVIGAQGRQGHHSRRLGILVHHAV